MFTFPSYIRTADWDIEERNTIVGASLAGTQQIVASGAAQWVADVTLRISPANLSNYRAWRARRRGALVAFPAGPNREWAGWPPGTSSTFSDGATFSDGSSFVAGSAATAAAPIGASTITVSGSGIGALWSEGRYFSFGDWLYIISEVVASDADSATINFRPPLRAPISLGQAPLYPPRTSMRLTSDDVGRVGDNFDGTIEISLSLREVI